MISVTEIWLIISTVITLATMIVRITPTQKDDAWLAKILKYVEIVATLFPKRK